MSITTHTSRNGNFTSSGIFALMGAPKPCATYIAEKNMERKLGRSLSMDKQTKATLWGHFLEARVHDMLPMSYEQVGGKTITHPHIPYWTGTPDNICRIESVVGDTKSLEPKAFCSYVDVLMTGDIELFKKEEPQKYWQLVSNSILTGMKNIEPIVYMPYESEIEAIRQMASNYDGSDQWRYRFIAESPLCELAYLPDGGYYKNLNRFRFEVPASDKEALTNAVLKYGKQLIQEPSLKTSPDNINGQHITVVEAA